MREDDGFSEALYQISTVGLNGALLISTVHFEEMFLDIYGLN